MVLLMLNFKIKVNVLVHVSCSFDIHVDVVRVGSFASFYARLARFAGESARRMKKFLKNYCQKLDFICVSDKKLSVTRRNWLGLGFLNSFSSMTHFLRFFA